MIPVKFRVGYLIWLFLCQGYLYIGAQTEINQSRRNAIVNAVELASPAVVNISTTRIEHVYVNPFFEDFWRSPFFEAPRVPQQRERKGLGSGVILSTEGHILTNYHVIENADLIQVILSDGRQYEAKLIGEDIFSDLALLKIKESKQPIEDLVSIQIGNSDDSLVGEWVIAIGHPFATSVGNPKPTVTIGVISAKDRSLETEKQSHRNLIQTDASINPGNSGGALVNAEGELIGINTAIYSTSGGSQGVGFAIPVSTAIKVFRKLIKYGTVVTPVLGITTQDLTPELADKLKVDPFGVLVAEVGKQNRTVGLKRGDIITTIDRNKIVDTNAFRGLVRLLDIGEWFTLQARRKDKHIEVKIEVAELEWSYQLKGWELQLKQPDHKENQNYSHRGVLVTQIGRRSELAQRGLKKGDLIYRIGDAYVGTLEQLKLVADQLPRGYPFSIRFERKGQTGIIRNLVIR